MHYYFYQYYFYFMAVVLLLLLLAVRLLYQVRRRITKFTLSSNKHSPSEAAKRRGDTNELPNIRDYFLIERQDGNGTYVRAYVYVSDVSKIMVINDYLRRFFFPYYSFSLAIWYFDSPGIAQMMLDLKVDDSAESTAAAEEHPDIKPHIVCKHTEQLDHISDAVLKI